MKSTDATRQPNIPIRQNAPGSGYCAMSLPLTSNGEPGAFDSTETLMIKAIETIYQGYRFRSRLEARWAIFLDGCQVQYKYEPEGVNLDGVLYLPDFFLPRLGCWFEVKGGGITEEASHKAYLLCRATRQPVIIAGDHFNVGCGAFMFYYWWLNTDYFKGVLISTEVVWGQCALCGMVAPVAWQPMSGDIYGLSSISGCTCGEEEGTEYWDRETPTIQGVYLAARCSRFEHGEHG